MWQGLLSIIALFPIEHKLGNSVYLHVAYQNN